MYDSLESSPTPMRSAGNGGLTSPLLSPPLLARLCVEPPPLPFCDTRLAFGSRSGPIMVQLPESSNILSSLVPLFPVIAKSLCGGLLPFSATVLLFQVVKRMIPSPCFLFCPFPFPLSQVVSSAVVFLQKVGSSPHFEVLPFVVNHPVPRNSGMV